MAIQRLATANALSAGDELWITPLTNESRWTQLIDWHLNLQISKSSKRKPLGNSESIGQLIKFYGLNEMQFEISKTAPVMISSSQLLPNRQTVVIPEVNNPSLWLQKTHAIWNSLCHPTLRLFLPFDLENRLSLFKELKEIFPEEASINFVRSEKPYE